MSFGRFSFGRGFFGGGGPILGPVGPPALTYAAFMALPSQPFNVLVEIQVRQSLRGWTFVASNTYSISYDPFTHPVSVRSNRGRYRGIDGVLVDLSPTAAAANLAACEATINSWFFDSATNLLYLHTLTGANPDTFGLIQALFTLRLSTVTQNFVGGNSYAGLLDGQELPTIHAEQQDFVSGLTVSSSGMVSAVNSDGFFDYPTMAWNWLGGTVTVLVGGTTLDYSQFQPLVTMLITGTPACADRTWQVPLRALSDALSSTLPIHTYNFIGPVQAINQGISALYAPMLFGYGYDMPVLMWLPGGGHLGWDQFIAIDTAALSQIGMFFIITAVYATDTATSVRSTVPTSDWFTTLLGRVDINQGIWPSTTYSFSVDAYTSVSPVPGAPASMSTIGDMVTRMLFFAGIGPVDSTAMSAADAASPEFRGVYVPGGQSPDCLVSVRDVIQRALTFEILKVSTVGKWSVQVWDPSFDLANTPILPEWDILGWSAVDTPTQPLASGFDMSYNPTQKLQSGKSLSTSSQEATDLLSQSKSISIASPYVQADDVAMHAARMMRMTEQAPIEFDVTLGPKYMTVQIGDKYRIQRARGPSTAPPPFDQVFEIIAFTKNPATMQVVATFSNMRGLGESAKRVAPPGTPAWGSATVDQKRQYLFAVDDALQRAASADPASFRPGFFW